MFTKYFHFFIFFITALFSTLSAQNPQRFIVVTPEKTGTHLLTKLIERLVNKQVHNCWNHILTETELMTLLEEVENNNSFLHIHALPTKELIHTLKKNHYKVCFLMRDPRDVMVSLLYYIEKGWSMGPCNLEMPYGLLSFQEKLHELITGERYGLRMVEAIILRRLGWMKESFVYTSYFENLVGAEGGGNDADQLKELVNLSRHLGIKLNKHEMKNITENLWGAEPGEKTTFRNGQIGSWKEEFHDEHKKEFKKRYSKLLIHLKYEKNSHW